MIDLQPETKKEDSSNKEELKSFDKLEQTSEPVI
jgi:hypothetical protein